MPGYKPDGVVQELQVALLPVVLTGVGSKDPRSSSPARDAKIHELLQRPPGLRPLHVLIQAPECLLGV